MPAGYLEKTGLVPAAPAASPGTSSSAIGTTSNDSSSALSYLDRIKLSATVAKSKEACNGGDSSAANDAASGGLSSEATTAKGSSSSSSSTSRCYKHCRPGKFSSQISGGDGVAAAARAADSDDDDFFGCLDRAEEEEKKKVKYWYEPGYVAGNEKTGIEDEEEESEEEAEDDSDGRCPDDEYVEVVPASGSTLGMARGGQHIQWGGISGKLALTDGPVTSPEDESAEVPDLEEVLDELLLPGVEAGGGEGDPGDAAAAGGSEDEPEVAAVVQTQIPAEHAKPQWSFNTVACGSMSSTPIEGKALRERYAVVDSEENSQVRSEAPQALAVLAIENDMLRREKKDEVLSRLKREEMRARAAKRGSCERLPGTKKAIGASQAWQDRKADQEPVKPFRGHAMLPGMFAEDPPKGGPDGPQSFAQHSLKIPKPLVRPVAQKPAGGTSRPFTISSQKLDHGRIRQ